MTTTQPAELPELPEGVTLEDLLIPLRAALSTCHDTDWSLRQFKTHITHALAALQSQPAAESPCACWPGRMCSRSAQCARDAKPAAAVSDEELLTAYNSIDPCNESPTDRLIRRLRAILALRPDAVPMTDERIVALVLEANAAPVETPTQAMTWIVRAVEAHHGITQRADGGEKQA